MKQDSIIKNKPLLTQSRLFLDVSSVIGKVAALEELTLAYREYKIYDKGAHFNWNNPLASAFHWGDTPQGSMFWLSVAKDI